MRGICVDTRGKNRSVRFVNLTFGWGVDSRCIYRCIYRYMCSSIDVHRIGQDKDKVKSLDVSGPENGMEKLYQSQNFHTECAWTYEWKRCECILYGWWFNQGNWLLCHVCKPFVYRKDVESGITASCKEIRNGRHSTLRKHCTMECGSPELNKSHTRRNPGVTKWANNSSATIWVVAPAVTAVAAAIGMWTAEVLGVTMGEFKSNSPMVWLTLNWQDFNPPRSPQSNGVAERVNKTSQDK